MPLPPPFDLFSLGTMITSTINMNIRMKVCTNIKNYDGSFLHLRKNMITSPINNTDVDMVVHILDIHI